MGHQLGPTVLHTTGTYMQHTLCGHLLAMCFQNADAVLTPSCRCPVVPLLLPGPRCACAARYAAEHSVAVTTFDCVSELEKIAVGYPFFKCVLRIRCDDASAKINLGLKYGADLCDVPMLLGMARDLDLEVCSCGVCRGLVFLGLM